MDRKDREINIAVIIWQIILSWRQLLCWGIVFAILFSGLKYVKDKRDRKDIAEFLKEYSVEDKRKLSEDVSLVKDVQKQRQEIEEYEEYMDNSLLLEINPYKKRVLELQYFVRDYSEQMENGEQCVAELVQLYVEYITGTEGLQKIIDSLGLNITSRNLAEVITVDRNASDSGFSIQILYPDKDIQDDIAKSCKELLKSEAAVLQMTREHTLVLAQEYENEFVDIDLKQQQAAIKDMLEAMKRELSSDEAELTDLQRAVLSELEQKENSNKEITGQEVKINKIFIILGFLIGDFLVCMWIGMKYLFAIQIQPDTNIEEMFQIPLLGKMEKNHRNTLGNKIDDIFRKIQKRNELFWDENVMVVKQIISMCNELNLNHICLSGSCYKKLDRKQLQILKNRLEEKGVQIQEEEDLINAIIKQDDKKALGTIILIEKEQKSFYRNIYKLMRCAEKFEVPILGMVLLD